MVVKSPQNNETEVSTAKKPGQARKSQRQESAKHQQETKMSNLVSKHNDVKCKTTEKNKASREIHTQYQNAQKQTNKPTHNCTIRICPHDTNAKLK